MTLDERRAAVRDIIDRLERPRVYAGDWAGDMADRILRVIDPTIAPHCRTCTCGCTCGYGGQHDPDKATCELNRGGPQ